MDAYQTLNELSRKAKLDMSDILNMVLRQVSIILHDGIDEKATQINWMTDADLKNNMVHLRFSPLYFGTCSQLGLPVKDVLKAFDYEQTPHGVKDTRKYEKVNEA